MIDPALPVTVLVIEPKEWTLRVSNVRLKQRDISLHPITYTVGRWIKRWHRRTRDTVTAAPYIELGEIGEDFIRNERHLFIRVKRIVNGQDYGLPDYLVVNAPLLAIPSRPPAPAVTVVEA